ncbi:hypothetical protein N7510_010306 [Penicillium lagena]|uniref:uncharacterized protein n=1 Tax=Penicillium lagena TaxID=94218 RepID=UPI0025417C86|nr:uncharacterized protein N7510_010306 [Penicillium lagena]KAJ5605152.1 hypothetical protein N7510_010306 [Penicillium lagena]
MAPRTRATDRCWTCRLRRKRCDGAQLRCQVCVDLGIPCYRSKDKPEWMDGGSQEKQMAETMKQQIKYSAGQRREKQSNVSNGSLTGFVVTSQSDFIGNPPNSSLTPPTIRAEPFISTQPGAISLPAMTTGPFSANNMTDSSKPLAVVPDHVFDLGKMDSTFPTASQAWELDLIMIYLDYVFPFLFPFYRPPIMGTGRAWLLRFVKQNGTVFHSVLSMSSFFLTVGLNDTAELADLSSGRPQRCRTSIWKEVSERAEKTFTMLQTVISELNDDPNPTILQRAYVMESILQLLIFDRFVGVNKGWEAHLTMAINIFEEIYNECSFSNQGQDGLICVLERMTWPGSRVIGFERRLWNADQAGFRFFTAILLYFDIIASTSLDKAPVLSHLHSPLIGDIPLQETSGRLNLLHFVGCHNWVLIAIGETSALSAWKSAQEDGNGLSQMDLVTRSQPIFANLQQGLEALDAETVAAADLWQKKPYYQSDDQITGHSGSVTTRIWAHAARIYLTVVVFGWRPQDSQIMEDCKKAIILLHEIDSIARLRTLAWPISIVGCISYDFEKSVELDSLVRRSEKSQLLHAIRESGQIIDKFRKADTVDNPDLFNFSCAFFNVDDSSYPAFLA